MFKTIIISIILSLFILSCTPKALQSKSLFGSLFGKKTTNKVKGNQNNISNGLTGEQITIILIGFGALITLIILYKIPSGKHRKNNKELKNLKVSINSIGAEYPDVESKIWKQFMILQR